MEQNHALNNFYKLMSRFKKYSVRIWEEDLSQGEFFMLFQIEQIPREREDERQEVSVTDLKKGCEVSMPAVSRMLHCMEKKGFVEFYNSRQDKRTTYIRLTDTGRVILGRAEAQMDLFFARISALMGEDKVRQMMELLRTFAGLVEEEIRRLEISGANHMDGK